MSDPFVRTNRSLGQLSSTFHAFLIIGGITLLLGWVVLAVALPLPQSINSVGGRVISALDPTRIVSDTEQRISELPVRLGDWVSAGDRLIAFDQQDVGFELTSNADALAEAESRKSSINAEISYLQEEFESQTALFASNLEKVAARARQVDARIEYFETAVKIYSDLRSNRQIDELKYSEVVAGLKEEKQKRIELQIEVAEIHSKQEGAEQEWGAKVARLRRDLSVADGEIAQYQTRNNQLDYQASQLEISAPHDGVIEGQASLSIGQSVPKNTWLMTVSPLGDFRFEAKFLATEAAGRLNPGAIARIHFDALPWTEFGMLDARVTRVGNEEVEGLVTVVLSFDQSGRLVEYAHHGLTGQAIVEVEQITLLQRLLRLIT